MIPFKLHPDSQRHRRAISSVEVLVAFTLLSGMLAISSTLFVKHGRMLQAQRHYRVALEELSNQLERLTTLPEAEVEQAVRNLEPSPFATAQLSGVKLEATLQPADVGRRLVLRIWWDEPQRREAPVALAAWIMPQDEPATVPSGDNPS